MLCMCGKKIPLMGEGRGYRVYYCDNCMVTKKVKIEKQRRLNRWELLQVEKEAKKIIEQRKK